MSTQTKSADLSKLGQAAPEYITATFGGTFYKATGSTKGGKEYDTFKIKTKIPLSAVRHSYIPTATFKKYRADQAIKKLGGHSFREIHLIAVEGALPNDLTFEQMVNWTADHDKLREIAKMLGKKSYTRIDLHDDKRYEEFVEINPDLYPNAQKLRFALLTFHDPEQREFFAREQKRLQVADANAPKDMEADLAALADD